MQAKNTEFMIGNIIALLSSVCFNACECNDRFNDKEFLPWYTFLIESENMGNGHKVIDIEATGQFKKTLMADKGITIKEIANILGVSFQSVNKYVMGFSSLMSNTYIRWHIYSARQLMTGS